MDTGKTYYDGEDNECSIWQMVRREPEWSANRIQEGEKAIEALAKAETEVRRLRELSVWLFNQGYASGHDAAVEGCYTDLLPVDMKTYHDDIVKELLEEAPHG